MEASGVQQADSREEKPAAIDIRRLKPAEYFGFVAALVLFASLFLPWFSTSETNPNSTVNGERGTFTAFGTYVSLDWLLVAACTAPFILGYIIVRRHELSWRPGEVTAIVGITAFVLIFCNGMIFNIGEPSGTISKGIGYWVGLIAAAGIAASGFVRQLEGAKKKPPGV